jgi:ribonuclease HI
MLKLNVDGAYMAESGTAGVGIILRRSDGSIVFTACRSLRLCSSALEAEISACIEGVRLALELNQDGILVETDSLEMVRMVTSTDADKSCLAHLVEDLRLLLSSQYIVSITKIPRLHNTASHELASFGTREDRNDVWLGSAPEPLLGRILRDCNNTII